MRKTLKLSLTLVLALAMLFAVAVIASAETTEPTASGDWSRDNKADSITWEYYADTQTLVISGKGAMADAANANHIPWFDYLDSITNVVIGEGVTRIGKNAFNNLTKVTEITVPDAVTYISKYAFMRMSNLETLNLGTGVKTIATDAFASLNSACQVNIKDLAAWCRIDFTAGSSNPVTYGNKKLALNGEVITELVFPEEVTKISKFAFRQNRGITSVVFHDGITEVGNQAFDGCTKLTKVTLDNCVIKFGNSVFRNCTTLVNTYVNNLDAWGKCTFATANSTPLGSGANRSCLWVNGLKYAKAYANQSGREYDTDAADVLVIPDGVTTLNANAFRQRTRNLVSVYVPESVTTFGGTTKNNGPFAYCNSLRTIYGVEGSAAQAYAEKVGLKFVACTFEEVTSITVDTEDTTLNIGKTLTATATVAPATITTAPIWKSSDLSVARVSNGVVTAVGAGEATITVSTIDGTISDSFVVTVPGVPVTGITLDKSEAAMEVGDTLKLVATVEPAEATDVEITWTSSNQKVATVANGVVEAIGGGETTITASVAGFEATCLITVEIPFVDVTKVTLDTTAAVLKVDETLQLTATVEPEDATEATVTWKTSDDSVATVVDGLVTAVGVGDATITATAGDVSATCTIKVEAKVIAVTKVTLDVTAATLEINETLQLNATVEPADATDATVTWTSTADNVATVVNGLVTAVGAGDATITATAGDVSATCTIKVNEPAPEYAPVEGISIIEELDIVYGETYQFEVTFNPANATDKSLYWESSNEDVAIIDEDGLLTALTEGDAIITVISLDNEDIYAECYVNVTSGFAVEGITLNKTTANLLIGDIVNLEVIFNPENATNKNVSWTTSSDAIATVEDGVVTAVSTGVATITATSEDGEFTATCKIIVQAGNETPPFEW